MIWFECVVCDESWKGRRGACDYPLYGRGFVAGEGAGDKQDLYPGGTQGRGGV